MVVATWTSVVAGTVVDCARVVVTGRISESPVTPKMSVQYFMNPDDLLYFSAAKGFRPGGVNQVLTSAAQGSLAQNGLTTDVLPKTFDSDSVWSYELGAKTTPDVFVFDGLIYEAGYAVV